MKFSILIIFFLTGTVHAQNTGIGTTTPTEKLDVNGNINITGVIKTNGADGAPGQVLTRATGNVLQWANLNTTTAISGNLQVFTATTAGAVQTFTVPAGVTTIMTEAWGGGGTGGIGSATFSGATGGAGGGGGGGYIKAVFSVSPGSTINIIVGLGATTAAVAGASSVTSGGITVSALPAPMRRYWRAAYFQTQPAHLYPAAGAPIPLPVEHLHNMNL